MDPETLFTQMRDIAAAPPPSFWPPAPGQIALAVLCAACIAAAAALIRRSRARAAPPEPQDGAALRQALEKLQQSAKSAAPSVQDAAMLAELVRAAALRRLPRHRCAGIHGAGWLALLEEHDPEGFRWTKQAGMLTDAPYRPDAVAPVSAGEFNAMCGALRAWLR